MNEGLTRCIRLAKMRYPCKGRLAARSELLLLGLGLWVWGCAGSTTNAPIRQRLVSINSNDTRSTETGQTTLSPSQVIELINQDATLVEHALIRARAKNDKLRATCLDDKLSQLHADGKNAQGQARSLEHAESADNSIKQREHSVMLRVLRRRAEALMQQADRCGARGLNETLNALSVEPAPLRTAKR